MSPGVSFGGCHSFNSRSRRVDIISLEVIDEILWTKTPSLRVGNCKAYAVISGQVRKLLTFNKVYVFTVKFGLSTFYELVVKENPDVVATDRKEECSILFVDCMHVMTHVRGCKAHKTIRTIIDGWLEKVISDVLYPCFYLTMFEETFWLPGWKQCGGHG